MGLTLRLGAVPMGSVGIMLMAHLAAISSSIAIALICRVLWQVKGLAKVITLRVHIDDHHVLTASVLARIHR